MKVAGIADKPFVVDLLLKAFRTNKSVNSVISPRGNREKRIRALMVYAFNYCHRFGKVFVNEEGNGVIMVLFPETKRTTIQTMRWDVQLIMRCVGFQRLVYVMKREQTIHSFHPVNEAVYLWFVGVDPAAQGRGFGTQLIEYVLKQYPDKTVLLETSTERNLPLYQRMGFKTYQTLDIGYALYMMKRNGAVQ